MGEENSIFEILEKRLDNALQPVNPEEKYISGLKTRLLSEPRISIERDSALKIILFICFAFITGFTILLFLNELFSRGKKKET